MTITYELTIPIGTRITGAEILERVTEGYPSSNQAWFLDDGAEFHFTAPWCDDENVQKRPVERIEFDAEYATARIIDPSIGLNILMSTEDFAEFGSVYRNW